MGFGNFEGRENSENKVEQEQIETKKIEKEKQDDKLKERINKFFHKDEKTEVSEKEENTEHSTKDTEINFSSNRELKSTEDKIKIANRNSNILEWEGEEGNSRRKPKDSESGLAKELSQFGIKGIPYKNGDVDFSPVSKYDINFENQDKLYQYIRKNIAVDKQVSSREDLNQKIRNKWQSMAKHQIVDTICADPEFAKDLQQKTGLDISRIKSVTDFSDELKRSGLTLHESPDCKKIQLVPQKIHKSFKHSGGTAEMLERLIDGDIHGKMDKNV